ncbi:MAG: hypothetical protein E3J86_00325 [Candidatus Thorarchaeota archaeon]|nr:MAG: hypothetical protein E3J86_00325 [Candidatus Thorarchaeota archaeon]
MGFMRDNPGIGLIVLGLFICSTSLGVSYLYAGSVFSIGDFSIEGGPDGPLSGPLFTLGIVVMAIGAYIQGKGGTIMKSGKPQADKNQSIEGS